MFMGLDSRPTGLPRKVPYLLSSVGGVIYFNPLQARGMPANVIISGTGNAFKLLCKPPPGNYEIMIHQFDGSGDTITSWDAQIRPFGGSWPALSVGAGKVDLLALASDGFNVVGTLSLGA